MKNIIFLIFLLFIFNSCSDELITIVDEYNPPYEIKAIPGDNSISISFWSGVLADDFAGFNLYISSSSTFTDALPNVVTGVGFPTYPEDTHTRSNFTLTFPPSAGIQNNDATTGNPNLYYVTVTAYGTNDLAENGRIETKINSGIRVVPRATNTGTGAPTGTAITGFDITGTTTVAAATGWQMKSYGYQTNFNAITVFTNDNVSSSAPYINGGLYITSNGSSLTKLWINPSGSGYTWATHTRANDCNTI